MKEIHSIVGDKNSQSHLSYFYYLSIEKLKKLKLKTPSRINPKNLKSAVPQINNSRKQVEIHKSK